VWTDVFLLSDEIRAALGGRDTLTVRRLTQDFAGKVASEEHSANQDVEEELVKLFKLIEHHRDLAMAEGNAEDSLCFSEALVAVNRVLRSIPQQKPIDQFVDHYHFLVAVRGHTGQFAKDAALWEEFVASLRAAVGLNERILSDPAVRSIWERQPHLRTGHYRRMAALSRALAACGALGKSEAEQMERDAERFARLGQETARTPAAEAMGNVTWFNPSFGRIEGRDGHTLHVTRHEILTPELREAVGHVEQVGPVPVDYDIEPSDTRPYPKAVNVRPPGSVVGEIEQVRPTQNFGIIRLADRRAVHFWLNDWPRDAAPPDVGVPVLSWPQSSPRGSGWTSQHVIEIHRSEKEPSATADAHRLIGEATEARERGHFDRARELFERGMRECPTPGLVCSYAAMMRTVELQATREIFQRGLAIQEVARSAKVWEDAGVFETQRGELAKAVEYLERAVQLARENPGQRGLKGALMALGHAYYKQGTDDAIGQADGSYQEAIQLFGGEEEFRARMPAHLLSSVDAAQVALARLRARSSGGQRTWQFLEKCGLSVVNADASPGYTDLACKIRDPLLRTDFGFTEQLFVRAYSSKQTNLNTSVVEAASGKARDCDQSVALVILPEISMDLEERLRRRLAPTDDKRPLVIVPLVQRDLEKSSAPLETLRKTLGSWLHQRDLFPRVGIVTGPEFFGRQRVLAEINSLLLQGEPIGLFGLRRTGKTSVLQAMKDRQRELGNIVLHGDLLGSRAKVISWLLYTLGEDLRKASEALLPPAFHWDLAGRFQSSVQAEESRFDISQGFFSDLSRVLQALDHSAVAGPKIVLVIDELEVLQQDSADRALDLLRTARGLQNRYRSRFDYIVTAANPSVCERGQIDGIDNPVFNCIHPLYLEFLTASECAEMITETGRGMGVSFEPEAVKRVYTATAGHPFFARYLCSLAVKLRVGRPVTLTAENIFNAEAIYNRDRSSEDCAEIVERLQRDYPEELIILRQLAESFAPIPLHTLRPGATADGQRAIRHLLHYQLAAATHHGIVLSMDLMRRWLTGSHTPLAEGRPRPAPLQPAKRPPAAGPSRDQRRPASRRNSRPGRGYDQR
ncbi:MAG: hypothetical protein QOD99_980, partial [Chthoniobacter sp.]|nr:hypothetical protein [Chthoniobacter sp.]